MIAEREAIVRIAKGLTRAQREIVMNLHRSALPAWALRGDHLGVKASADIRKMPKGVIQKEDMKRYGSRKWWYRLTPLGLAVRDHLKESTGDGK